MKMSLITLPEEVLEIILLYVNTKDVLNVLSVVNRSVNEGFWRRICLQSKYKKINSEDEEPWQCVFLRNVNWLKGSYVKSEYNFRDLPIHEYNAEGGSLENRSTHNMTQTLTELCHPVDLDDYQLSLLGHTLSTHFYLRNKSLLFQRAGEVLIMDCENLNKPPKILIGECLNSCNLSITKLLIRNPGSVIIYSLDNAGYKKLLTWKYVQYSDSLIGTPSFILTDHYFTVVNSREDKIKVFDLRNVSEEYLFFISGDPTQVRVFTVSVHDNVIYILILNGSKFLLRRHHLVTREWLEEITLFSGAALIGDPQVKLNEKFVVSWTWLMERPGTELKFWALENNVSHHPTLMGILQPEKVLWLEMKDNYVIYSSSITSFSILNMNEQDKIETMTKCGENYLGQNIVSWFLVLSYTHHFEVVDFQNATYLHTVLFDSGLENTQFFANDFFYTVYSNCFNTGLTGGHKLVIYDFRGQLLRES